MSHAIHKIVSKERCQSYFISRRSPHLGISKDSESCASAHRCLHYAYARLIARVTFHSSYKKGILAYAFQTVDKVHDICRGLCLQSERTLFLMVLYINAYKIYQSVSATLVTCNPWSASTIKSPNPILSVGF